MQQLDSDDEGEDDDDDKNDSEEAIKKDAELVGALDCHQQTRRRARLKPLLLLKLTLTLAIITTALDTV